MAITVAQVDDLRLMLREMPAQEEAKQKLTLQQAIARMADELTELQRRGYSIDDIANILRGTGLEISPQSLKSYLSRSRSTTKQRRRRSVAAATRNKNANGRELAAGQAVAHDQDASEHAGVHAALTHGPLPVEERLENSPGNEHGNSHVDRTGGSRVNNPSDTAGGTQVDCEADSRVDCEVDRAVDRRVENPGDQSVNDGVDLCRTVRDDGSGGASSESAGNAKQDRTGSPGIASTRDQPQPVARSSSFVPRADSPVI